MARTLNDFLTKAGVKLASAEAAPAVADAKVAAPATPAPAKTAAPVKAAAEGKGTIPPAQPSKGEANDGHKVRDVKTEHEMQDTGGKGKTAQQLELEAIGINVSDAKIAAALHGDLLQKQAAVKRAELEKQAAEVRAQGALLYQGMIEENTCWKLATGEASYEDAASVAKALGVSLENMVKRAEQIGGALPSPALVGGNLGSAARVDNSVVMRKGEEAKTEIQTRDVEAIAGTRAPVSGADEKLKRFTDVITLPGNPGLNHGQAVDQGKALGA